MLVYKSGSACRTIAVPILRHQLQTVSTLMANGMKTLLNRKRAFWADEQGAVTVEFVLWFPIVIGFVLMIADVSMILSQRSGTVRIIEDAHRLRSIGVLTTDLATESYIRTQLGGVYSRGASIDSGIIAGTQTTVVQIPVSNIDMLGIFVDMVGVPRISIVSQQLVENWEI